MTRRTTSGTTEENPGAPSEAKSKVPEDILNVVRQLTEATTKGLAHQVPAVETQIPEPGERNDFVLTMPDYSVNVYKEPTEVIGLSILGKTGHALMYFQSSPDENEYATSEALLSAASWKAAKIDLILADVDRALKGGEVLGNRAMRMSPSG